MKYRQALLALVFAVAFRASIAGAIDITGKWQASFDTPIGPMHDTYDFVLKDGKLTGKIKSSMFGDAEVLEGKVDGDTVSFVEMMDSSIRVEYSGKIVSADEIDFTRQVGEFGTEDLVAKRVKESGWISLRAPGPGSDRHRMRHCLATRRAGPAGRAPGQRGTVHGDAAMQQD